MARPNAAEGTAPVLNPYEIKQLTIKSCALAPDLDNCQAFIEQCVAQRVEGVQEYALSYYHSNEYSREAVGNFSRCLSQGAWLARLESKNLNPRSLPPVFSPTQPGKPYQCVDSLTQESALNLQFAERLLQGGIRSCYTIDLIAGRRALDRLKATIPSNDDECVSLRNSTRYIIEPLMRDPCVRSALLNSDELVGALGCSITSESLPYTPSGDDAKNCTPRAGKRVHISCPAPEIRMSYDADSPACIPPPPYAYTHPAEPVREPFHRPSGADFKGERPSRSEKPSSGRGADRW